VVWDLVPKGEIKNIWSQKQGVIFWFDGSQLTTLTKERPTTCWRWFNDWLASLEGCL